jgi:hypothetical protein
MLCFLSLTRNFIDGLTERYQKKLGARLCFASERLFLFLQGFVFVRFAWMVCSALDFQGQTG